MDRDNNLDLLRAVAILFVLIMHSAIRYVPETEDLFAGHVFRLLARPGVATFLFVSGALFLDSYDVTYLTRRIKRVIVPYFVFSVLALALRLLLNLLINL